MTQEFAIDVHSPSANIGKLLLENGKLSAKQAESILALQKEQNIRFGEAALRLGYIQPSDIQFALSRQFAYPYLERDDASVSSDLVAAYDPFAPVVEQLRSLRSQLMLRWIADGNKAIALVSHEQTTGNSAIAANLAVVFSQLGERTLVIDANLRTPRQHELFRVENRLGLSDILADRSGLGAIQRIDKMLDLSVLTAGTQAPNPQELLSRPRFMQLLSEVYQEFDVIILDTPAMVSSADAQVVASRARAALLVANRNETKVAGLKMMVDMIRTSGATVLGCIMNEAQ